MKKAFLSVFVIALMISGLASIGSVNLSTQAQPPESNANPQWVPDSALVNGLPELGLIGENCQCSIFNLTGNNQWSLIIGQTNSWTLNEHPFLGYYWDGSQWTSNSTIVQGLTAYPNENDPTVGFNVTGDNKFDMIVAQWAGYNPTSGVQNNYGPCWTGYSWTGSQWVVNSTIINGLPTNASFGGGNNYATLGYNVLGDGKWDLVVDNYGNNGYVGFEWNGTAWAQESNLVNGLPNAGSPGNSNQFPIPCLTNNLSNDNTPTLIVGYSSGGGPNGSIQSFQWEGTIWVSNPAFNVGVTNLQPWPNSPTVAYNITGNGRWELLIGSSTANPDQPTYYTGYYWSANSVPLSVSITPLSVSMNIGESLNFTSIASGGTWPYNYQWYVNSSAVSGATTTSWVFTPATSGTFNVSLNVTDSTGNTVQSDNARIQADYFTKYNITFDKTGIGTDYNGTVVTIDGSNYTANDLPLVFSWSSFSTHTFAFQSSLLLDGNTTGQYDWASTSGLSTSQSDTFNVTRYGSVIGNYNSQKAVPINRVQGCFHASTLGNSLIVNLAHTPTSGDVLVAIISTVTNTGSPAIPISITEAGVDNSTGGTYWSGVAGGGGGGTAPGEHGLDMEIWVGKVGQNQASRTINVTLNAVANLGATVDVCEYSGISKIDSTWTNGTQSNTANLSTGSVISSMNGELAVGGIFDEGYNLTNASNGFTLSDGIYSNNQALAYLEKTNCPIGEESSTIAVSGSTDGYGCIAVFQPTLVKSNVTVTDQEAANGVLTFTASGPNGQLGYVNVTIPFGFNATDITAFIDNQPVQQPTIITDGSNYFVYFEFHLSTHNIIIQYAASPTLSVSSPSPSPDSTATPTSTAIPTQTPDSSQSSSSPTPTDSSNPTIPEFSAKLVIITLLVFMIAILSTVVAKKIMATKIQVIEPRSRRNLSN